MLLAAKALVNLNDHLGNTALIYGINETAVLRI